jgi:hypothetical protein
VRVASPGWSRHTNMGLGLPSPSQARLEVGEGADGRDPPISGGKEREGERKRVASKVGQGRREKRERRGPAQEKEIEGEKSWAGGEKVAGGPCGEEKRKRKKNEKDK